MAIGDLPASSAKVTLSLDVIVTEDALDGFSMQVLLPLQQFLLPKFLQLVSSRVLPSSELTNFEPKHCNKKM